MKIARTRVICLLIILPGLTACEKFDLEMNQLKDNRRADASVLYDEGATRLTSEQTKQHVSGNTESWKGGAIYYDPDGNLELFWHKNRIKGNWEMQDSGTICFDIPKWNITCHYYLDHNGAITTIQNEKVIGNLKIEPGKHLGR